MRKWKIAVPRLIRSKRAILYLLLALGALFLETEDLILNGLGLGECDQVTLPVRMLYQRFTTLGHISRSHRVWIVSFSPEQVPVTDDPCSKRAFVAALLRRLSQFSPAAVAIDFWYPPGRCMEGSGHDLSQELVDALQSTPFPVVLGAESSSWNELESRPAALSALEKKGFSHRDQLLSAVDPALLPAAFGSGNVHSGLARLNCDNRRIPLEWRVYPEQELKASAAPATAKTLSYETASLVETGILPPGNDHPFTGLLNEQAFTTLKKGSPQLNAEALLCRSNVGGAAARMRDWSACPGADPALFAALRGSVILIGEKYDPPNDWHDSVLGRVPGYVLHANYIDALLVDFYFTPLPVALEFGLILAGMLLIAVIFEVAPSIRAALLWSVLGIAVLAVACSLLQLALRIYLGFWLALVPIPALEGLFYLRSSIKPQHRHTVHVPAHSAHSGPAS